MRQEGSLGCMMRQVLWMYKTLAECFNHEGGVIVLTCERRREHTFCFDSKVERRVAYFLRASLCCEVLLAIEKYWKELRGSVGNL